MEKRKVAEMNEVRSQFYAGVEGLAIAGHSFAGMSPEGAVFVNEEGNAVVVKVVAKALGFDVEGSIAELKEKVEAAAIKVAEKAEKDRVKAEKAEARAKEKAEKDAAKAEKKAE